MTKTTEKNRITRLFEKLKADKKKGFIAFITAGDPDIVTTKEIILELERSGADMIELGIPFSDPMADGPTIQASYERAVKAGVHLTDVLKLVAEVRKESQIPLVLFGYYNPVFNHGLKKFAKDVSSAGADGVLIVDLPPEESDELKGELDKSGVDLIFLLTPTSDEKRMRLVASKASGFVYFVSVTGVTGARSTVAGDLHKNIKRVRKFIDLPLGVGFGISTPEQAKEVCKSADAAVVGSAIVNIISKNKGPEVIKEAGSFVAGLKGGL